MKSLVALVALLGLFACGQAADDDSSPMEATDAQPAAAAPAASLPAPGDAPVGQPGVPVATAANAAPEPTVAAPAPVASPVPAPAPAPAPVVEPVPAAPTAERPLIVECTPADCAPCTADLIATQPDWYRDGAILCQMRTCAAASECDSLGPDLVCKPVSEPGRAVCRQERLHAFQACDESAVNPCELGLLCSAGRCRAES